MAKGANGTGGRGVQLRMNSHSHLSRGPALLVPSLLLAILALIAGGCANTGGSTVIDPPTPPGLPDTPAVEVPNPPGVR